MLIPRYEFWHDQDYERQPELNSPPAKSILQMLSGKASPGRLEMTLYGSYEYM